MSANEILEELLASCDEKYREFTSALVPDVMNIIGVRMPRIRAIAKKYACTEVGNRFISELPHA